MHPGGHTILEYTMPHKGTASAIPSKILGYSKTDDTVQRRE